MTWARWAQAASAPSCSRSSPECRIGEPSPTGTTGSGGAHDPRGIVEAMPPSDQTRLLIVEDVPQVAQYIRGLLNAQARGKFLDVLTEGGRAIATINEVRPDVVLVDALLQGRIKGPKLVEQIYEAKLGVPVIMLTVPQNPIDPDPAQGIHGVLSMP